MITDIYEREKEFILNNTNKLLECPGYKGFKTGWTSQAQSCLATHFKRYDYEMR